MSILIRGMEMPMSGRILIVFPSGRVSEVSADATQDIFRETQAVPVPEHGVQPHGRLIDADALIADIKRQCREVFRVDAVSPDDFWITRNEAYNERLWKTWCKSFFDYLRTRPTIIPAEEGENGT